MALRDTVRKVGRFLADLGDNLDEGVKGAKIGAAVPVPGSMIIGFVVGVAAGECVDRLRAEGKKARRGKGRTRSSPDRSVSLILRTGLQAQDLELVADELDRLMAASSVPAEALRKSRGSIPLTRAMFTRGSRGMRALKARDRIALDAINAHQAAVAGALVSGVWP